MSLALYRKYRPATFAELKGQEHVAEPLQQALRNGRINHAYLFSGPRGCGKTSSARILARSLNCELGPTPDPCGKCDSCVALGPSGTGHIDVIEIDAASHGGVDDARDLRERAFFAPVAARFKVYIIDEAHMVTREGFNALLKLVEEPPPHLKFVFATTEPEKVIGTIRSRTHHYPFRLIPPGVLQELVEEILKAEDVPYETSALPLAVRAGAGSARDTLSILDQLLAGSDEQGITYARAVSLLGYTDSALLDEVIAAFAARDGAAVFAAIDRVVESGQDPRRFTADLLERVRDLVILSNVPEAGGTGLLNVPPDELEAMRRQASSMGPGELTRAADLLHTGLTEMRGATSPRLLLELICARILLPAAYEDEASMFARLDRLERQASQGSVAAPAEGMAPAFTPPPAPAPAPAPPQAERPSPPPAAPAAPERPAETRPPESRPAPPPEARPAPQAEARPAPSPPAQPSQAPAAGGGMDFGTVQRLWPDVVEAVKQKSRATWMTIMSGVQPVSLDGKVLTLGFDAEGRRLGFVNGGRETVLREVFKERMGVDWRIDTVVGGGGGGGGGARPSNPGPGGGRPGGGFGNAQSSGFGGSAPSGGFGNAAQPAPQAAPQAARPNPAPRPADGESAARQADPGPLPPPPDEPPPPPEPAPMDESDEVDPEGDADADGTEAEMNGMALIQRELGGQIIREIDNT
ncbi:DNA polymerase III subunit gamma and tau [Actinomadura sp. NAK00032]|uniref:DNA polymerase III subunit gamma and tau n=1 Tax=Actinomadura sp. NAK00032 TaxID=2742128 RepID=UPI001590C51A|nr:DNA polymerase III subunit gamma and tau [Actinomadura sp. NAK00032]QKW39994.1 DNA polymerase III subunit gamma and tau [Actinomadura sp. NAK00032]